MTSRYQCDAPTNWAMKKGTDVGGERCFWDILEADVSMPFCIISVLIHSRVQRPMDVRSWNQSSIWSIGHIDRRGKNQVIVGLPRCNMNPNIQILGKSEVLTVKSRSETHFYIKRDGSPQHLHSLLKKRCLSTLKRTLTSQLDDVNCGHLRVL